MSVEQADSVAELIARSAADGMVQRRIVVPPEQVVYVMAIVEASEGLALVLAEHGGELTLLCTPEQQGRLDELIADLQQEIPLRLRGSDASAESGRDAAPLSGGASS